MSASHLTLAGIYRAPGPGDSTPEHLPSAPASLTDSAQNPPETWAAVAVLEAVAPAVGAVAPAVGAAAPAAVCPCAAASPCAAVCQPVPVPAAARVGAPREAVAPVGAPRGAVAPVAPVAAASPAAASPAAALPAVGPPAANPAAVSPFAASARSEALADGLRELRKTCACPQVTIGTSWLHPPPKKKPHTHTKPAPQTLPLHLLDPSGVLA